MTDPVSRLNAALEGRCRRFGHCVVGLRAVTNCLNR